MSNDINTRFDFHAVVFPVNFDAHTSVRQIIKRAAEAIEERVPAGREQSLAITKLEEAMFWANAGIARHNTEEK